MAVVHVEVRGIVQGVGFRWFVREIATRERVAGWVRNRDDGAVEVAAAGDDAQLERFLGAVRRGPPGALVREVRALASPVDPAPTHPFLIMR